MIAVGPVRGKRGPGRWSFSPPIVASLRPVATRFPAALGRALLATPLKRLLLWIQLRTRAIDDIVTASYRDGGRQIVILGAGYDSRATRAAPVLLADAKLSAPGLRPSSQKGRAAANVVSLRYLHEHHAARRPTEATEVAGG